MNIGEKISKLRQEYNLNKEELANRLGYGKSIITYWEKNERTPNAQAIIALADFFQVSADYLLGRSDDYSVNTISSSDLSDDQQYIVTEYNKLSSSDKQKIVNYMAICTARAEKKSDNSLTPMEEELITMTRKLEDKNQLAQILGFLEELLEDSNNRKKDTNTRNNHRNIS